MKGFTATLLAKWTRFTDDQKRVMLETVNADADRVTRLITELLDVSRIEACGSRCTASWWTSRSARRKIVAGRVAAGDQPDLFRIVASDELPETWLDADKIDQILGNLVENAVRHGAGTVTIVIQPVDDLPARAETRPGGTRAVMVPSAAHGSAAPGAAVSVRDEGDGCRLSWCRGSSGSSGAPSAGAAPGSACTS